MGEKLSQRIRQAVLDHRRAFPDGDWKAVNENLSQLFFEAMPILLANGIDPWAGGNEGRAKSLEALKN